MTELRIFPHQDHWHVQWLADGEQEDVYADGCDGYATHAAAVAARSELQERYDHLGCVVAPAQTGRCEPGWPCPPRVRDIPATPDSCVLIATHEELE